MLTTIFLKLIHKLFYFVFLESCQCPEPAILCPLLYGCQQLILVGDNKQLGPTVLTSDATSSKLLKRSIFQRLIDQGVKPFLLNTQYRMYA